MNLRGLRLLTVVGPLLFLGAIELLRFSLPFEILRPWPFSLALLGIFAITIVLFSRTVLDHVERMQERLVAQNASLIKLEENARTQAAMLHGLHEAGLSLVDDLSLDSVLQRVVDLAKELGKAEYGALGVFDDEQNIRRFITSGLAFAPRADMGDLPKGRGLLGALHHVTTPIRVRNIADHPDSFGFPQGHPPMTSFMGVPIRYKDRHLGNLYLTNKHDADEFSELDSSILEQFAAQAAVAIENAALHEQVQHLAIEEERQRIAREMHDGLAQVLGYVNMKTGAVRRLLALGRVEQAEHELRDLESAAQEVYVEVREAILGLRTMTQGTDRLYVILREYIKRFTDLTNIPVELELTCEEADLDLAPRAEVQLIRVIQEALSNVRKHAKASRAVIRIGMDDRTTRLVIADDGVGFLVDHLTSVDGPKFGLHTMRERVVALGGELSIHSVPNHGTQITVRLPRRDGSGPQ